MLTPLQKCVLLIKLTLLTELVQMLLIKPVLAAADCMCARFADVTNLDRLHSNYRET